MEAFLCDRGAVGIACSSERHDERDDMDVLTTGAFVGFRKMDVGRDPVPLPAEGCTRAGHRGGL